MFLSEHCYGLVRPPRGIVRTMSESSESHAHLRRALILEDDSLTLILLESLLLGFGFEVWTATNVSEGKKLLRDHDPDLALLDIDLGFGPTGIDFAKMLARTHPHIATVFLSHVSEVDSGVTTAQHLPKNVAYLNKLGLHDTETVRRVIETCLRPGLHNSPLSTVRPAGIGLSQSQYEVLLLVSRGSSASEIADQRGTSVRAVQRILHRIQDSHPEILLDSKSSRELSASDFLEQHR